jgi:redox-sensitive bicupin YhaK (pirin superfamily)
MEIVSYVLEGALAHRDSMGNDGAILPGDVQRMSAGNGVRHSEFNHARDQTTHFLQIWILPDRSGIPPSYEQKHFEPASKRGRLTLVADPAGAEGAVTLNADARLRAGLFDGTESADLTLDPARITYVHLVRGELQVNGHALQAGDALTLKAERQLQLAHGQDAEVLVFDLAP